MARHTPVAECQALLNIEPLLAHRDEPLGSLLRRASAQPATRVVGVVGDDDRLVGILPILRLAESVIARVVPEALLADIVDITGVARFGRTVEARTAGEAMLPPASVTPATTIGDAFRVMHALHLSGLYVVDGEGRPSGYLDLLELALVYLGEIERRSTVADAPSDHPAG